MLLWKRTGNELFKADNCKQLCWKKTGNELFKADNGKHAGKGLVMSFSRQTTVSS